MVQVSLTYPIDLPLWIAMLQMSSKLYLNVVAHDVHL